MVTNNVSLLIIYLMFIVSRVVCEDDIFPSNNAKNKRCIINAQNKRSKIKVNESDESRKIESRLRVKIYTGSSIENSSMLDLSIRDTKEIFKNIDRSKPFVIYIHGYLEHSFDESIRTVVGAYLKRGTDNIMLLDWSSLASAGYITVVSRVQEIARILARTFDDLVKLGLQLENSHFIGHSLGGQIAGFAGKRSRNFIPRITGLDPANPCFYGPGEDHIDIKSAKFVDIIHTNVGFLGASENTGTVDFIANRGTWQQPGCSGIRLIADLCSHQRSWRYYAESVLNENAFPAVECKSYDDFSSGKCVFNRLAYVGYSTPTDLRGTYYFETKARSPFAKNSITKKRVKV